MGVGRLNLGDFGVKGFCGIKGIKGIKGDWDLGLGLGLGLRGLVEWTGILFGFGLGLYWGIF